MPREGYRAQLSQLRQDVLYMSELVLERLQMGLDALEQRDEELAWEVIEGDDEINELYLNLERDCMDILALQQPVASDLRFVAASFKIITDLERIADLAVNLGDYAIETHHENFPEVDIQSLGSHTVEMVEEAMDAYHNELVEPCYAIAERDNDIDERCEEASRIVLTDLLGRQLDMSDEQSIDCVFQDVSRVLLTIRDLERVGDHAVNIAARTLYMIESNDELIY